MSSAPSSKIEGSSLAASAIFHGRSESITSFSAAIGAISTSTFGANYLMEPLVVDIDGHPHVNVICIIGSHYRPSRSSLAPKYLWKMSRNTYFGCSLDLVEFCCFLFTDSAEMRLHVPLLSDVLERRGKEAGPAASANCRCGHAPLQRRRH
ncbi:hypothetical protein TMatcc_006973 [Talaromyces marneffei ATCC 18224]